MNSEDHTCGKGCLNIFSLHYEGLIILIPPILFLPVMLMSDDVANRCMYLLLVMAVYWISEVIPLGVTSMLPILAFPLMDIMSTEEACRLYFRDTLVMFVTSIMVATAIEYSKLHIRLALRVLQIVGCSPRRLHFGLCGVGVTMFMSIWIANSACTAMMCPIIFAVLDQLTSQGLVKQYDDDDADLPKPERRPSNLGNCFYLSVSYAASIGGVGSLIGTPTNLAFKGIYDSRFPNSEEKLEFGTYLAYALPFVFACTFFMFLSLEIVFMGLFRPNSKEAKEIEVGKEGEEIGKRVIDEKYRELGPITTHEITIAILFVLLIFLYIGRKPGFMDGWAELFENPSIKNSAPTIMILILIFALPGNYKFLKFWTEESLEKTPALLTWEFIVPKVPWGLIFLVGGGATLAEGSKVSGMATKLGKSLSILEVLPASVLLLVVITTAVILTNFSANVAIANITVPVLAEMAVAMKIHPLYLIFPVGLACSMAFMLPVGTPPNALVQGYANIETKNMAFGGLFVSITTILSIWLLAQTWGVIIFPNTRDYPNWADEEANETRSINIFWDEL